MTARRAAVLLVWLAAFLGGQVVAAGSAAAHAELVSTTPADGTRLDAAPAEVVLEFTEPVGLVTGGLRLLDTDGEAVGTADPVVEGSSVRWEMPGDLPDGGYVVSWRVLSGDGHPISGAFAFGVGAEAPEALPAAASTDAPWPVVLARLAGYLGYTLLAGAVAVAVLCWAAGRRHRAPRLLLRTGLVVTALAAVTGHLLQGPYVAGLPLTQWWQRALIAETAQSSFGAWTELRVYLLVALAALLWPAGALEGRFQRWFALGGVAATAVTFSGTGHAATGSVLDRAVDSAHVLFAGTWLGGLLVLVAAALMAGDRPDRPSYLRFSRLALLSVVGLVATGTLNSLSRLDELAALRETEYGRLLAAKLVLVVAALGVAAASRALLHRRGATPWRTLQAEAAITLAVLAVTSVLASTAPTSPSDRSGGSGAPAATTVEMALGGGRTAVVRVDGVGTTGSSVAVEALDADGQPLDVAAIRMQATLEAQDVGPLDVPLTAGPDGWTGEVVLPYAGEWTLRVTVEDQRLNAVVTSGVLQVG